MKKLYLLVAISLCSFFLSAQTTDTIKLNSAGEDATIDNYNPNNNNPNGIEYCMGGWTINGTSVAWRNVMKFDLSTIPTGAVVQSAKLSLYFPDQNSFSGIDTSLTNSNESLLQRVTSPWSEDSITWSNQPTTTTLNEVDIPQSSLGTQDYPDMNVTAMVQQMLNNPATNFGFMLQAANETPYARMLFASGDNPDSSKHPVLVITYSDCISQTLDAEGADATIDDFNPDNNYPNEIEYCSGAWTINGSSVIWRDLFQFDLASIPANATITSAQLSLFFPDSNSFQSGDTSLTNSNESVLQRITSAWYENSVTWNNQPSSTNQHEVIVPPTVGNQDYPGIDVKDLVQDMVNDAANSFGFLLKLTNEMYYARMLFASGDNPDASIHPRLDVCWAFNEAVNELSDANGLSIYPNPSSGIFNVSWNDMQHDFNCIKITNCIGEIVMNKTLNDLHAMQSLIDLTNQPKGVYIVYLEGKSKQVVRKLIIH